VKKRSTKRQKKGKGVSMFFEDKAEEDNEISDPDDEDAERPGKIISKEDQYYKPEVLQRRAPGLNKQFIDRMEVDYKDTVQNDEDLEG
jgi:hypothetical protein